MAKTIAQLRKEWLQIHNDLEAQQKNNTRDINVVRRAVREKILREQEINKNSELEVLLQKEYELEREENKLSLTLDLISKGKNPKSATFEHELNKLLVQSELESMGYQKHQLDDHRKTIQEKVILGEEIPKADIAGQLLAKEFMHDRELRRIAIEEKFDKSRPGFQNFVDLRMMIEDSWKLDQERLNYYENEFKDKKGRNEEIDLSNGYFRFLQKESELTAKMEAAAKEAKQKEQQEKIRQEELNKKIAEDAKKEAEILVEAVKETTAEKPSGGLFARIRNLFRRTPKEAPVVTESVKTEVKEETTKEETTKEETKEKETEKENLTQETSVKEKEIDEETKKQQEIEAQNKLLEEEKQKEEKKKREEEQKKREEEQKKREEEQAHRYRVEFAGKELQPEIRNCGDPKVLGEYLQKAASLKPEVQEHLKARILANAKIQSLEESRAMIQKNRPPAVKYKDGTILLKNKKKDVPKQTTINGCWSAVLSDMLGHFGVDLSQEEIRAYRPELQSGKINEPNALMDRLNNDSMNEINDMADLIQRTVPNVAHHHMSLGANREENKAVLKETVADALLNKNSPVAVLYGNHYLSIVGIKNDTLIVQNPAAGYDTQYQKLSIDDLFNGCNSKNGMGQVTIDWLEDLKFQKDGTCKNMNDQWKSMGIDCKGREFGKGQGNNYDSHVRGYEFDDDSRIKEGIEETIYLPKMSFGKEKDMMKAMVKEQQLENVKQGATTMEAIQKHEQNLVKDEPEHEKDENEMTLDELNNEL